MNKHTWTCWINIYIYMYLSTSNKIYTYKLSKNQFNTTCCSVGFRIFLETRHLSPHEQCSKGTQTWKQIDRAQNILLRPLETKPFTFAYTSFSNTKVLSLKCDAYHIMYSNEILPWGGLLPLVFPILLQRLRHVQKPKLQTSSCVGGAAFAFIPASSQVANHSMGKTVFFWQICRKE